MNDLVGWLSATDGDPSRPVLTEVGPHELSIPLRAVRRQAALEAERLDHVGASEAVLLVGQNRAVTYVNILATMLSGRSVTVAHPGTDPAGIDTIRRALPARPAGASTTPPIRALTSGTTGIPKIIEQSREFWCATEQHDLPEKFLDGADFLTAGPPSSAGVLAWALLTLAHGGSLRLMTSGWNPDEWLQHAASATGALLTPALVRSLMACSVVPRADHLTLIIGGDLVSENELSWVKENLTDDVWVYYGTSECGMISALSPDEEFQDGCVGRVVRGASVRIDGGSGEIVFLPSWSDDEIWTGDVGHLDDRGRLHVTGRLDDMMNVSGMKVWPAQVEDVIVQHPQVKECAVVAVPDPAKGQVPVAYVVGDLSEHDLRQYAESRLVWYQRPSGYVFVDQIPTNAAGKIDRGALLPDRNTQTTVSA